MTYDHITQHSEANLEKTEAVTSLEKAKQRIQFLKSQLKDKQPRVAEAEKENKEMSKQLTALQKEIDLLKRRSTEINYSQSSQDTAKCQLMEKQKELEQIQRQIDQMTSSGQLANLDFSYSLPRPGFDRSKVKGMIAKLVKIDSANMQFTTALQVCAEGRLYFVSETTHNILITYL